MGYFWSRMAEIKIKRMRNTKYGQGCGTIKTLLCYLQERSFVQQVWEVELTTEVSVKLSDPLPSRYPTKMHIDVHSKACGRQQHSATAPAWRLCKWPPQQNGCLETQRNTLENECAKTTQNNMKESHRRMKGENSQIPKGPHCTKRGKTELPCVEPWEA